MSNFAQRARSVFLKCDSRNDPGDASCARHGSTSKCKSLITDRKEFRARMGGEQLVRSLIRVAFHRMARVTSTLRRDHNVFSASARKLGKGKGRKNLFAKGGSNVATALRRYDRDVLRKRRVPSAKVSTDEFSR